MDRRVILHVDVNAMYSSCHQAIEPDRYGGKPVAVAGDPQERRGIILTASYEARKFGIKTTMPVWEAKRLCPHLILIRPDYQLYREFNRKILELFTSYTPLVEPFSIDEAWLDVTGSLTLFGSPKEIAQKIQQEMKQQLGLPCSIGIADSKLLAKMGSSLQKPLGIREIYQQDVPDTLWPMSIEQLFGIGEKIAEKMRRLGITTIGDLAQGNQQLLQEKFGVIGLRLQNGARGIDPSPVDPEVIHRVKSIGHSVTLPRDVMTIDEIKPVLLGLSDQVGRRIRKKGLAGNTITATFRYDNRSTITRSMTLPVPTDLGERIYQSALDLTIKNWREGDWIRLVGVSISNLVPLQSLHCQLDLFAEGQKDTRQDLSRAVDKIRDKYGDMALMWAGMLGNGKSLSLLDHRRRGTSLQKHHLQDREYLTPKD